MLNLPKKISPRKRTFLELIFGNRFERVREIIIVSVLTGVYEF